MTGWWRRKSPSELTDANLDELEVLARRMDQVKAALSVDYTLLEKLDKAMQLGEFCAEKGEVLRLAIKRIKAMQGGTS